MRLNGEKALVTGAGQGIGRAIVLAFAREGAGVVINDVNIESAQRVAAEVKSLGGEALAMKADVSSSAEVNLMVRQSLEAFGRIDILVNNAGILKMIPSEELAEEEWDRIIDVNLKGQFLCCQAVGRDMIKKKQGKIINIASMSAHRGRPGNLAYCVSKGGTLQLTRTLAMEWAKYHINVNTITPGLTQTGILDPTGIDFQERVRRIPLRRMNRPEDIANAVVFLASSESDNITGSNITVDCGALAMHPGYLGEFEN